MLSAAELLNQYIGATRGEGATKHVRAELRDFYQSIFQLTLDQISAASGRDLPPVLLRVVYSGSLEVETVDLGSVYSLIYDQYAGQTLNQLSRFFFEDTITPQLSAYLRKVFGVIQLRLGNVELATHLALVFHWQEGLENLSEVPKSTLRQTAVALIEEFVIGHEIIHAVFRSDPALRELLSHNYLVFLRAGEDYNNWALSQEGYRRGSPDAQEPAVTKLLSDWKRSFFLANGRSPSPAELDEETALINRAAEEMADGRLVPSSLLERHPEALEECVCDAVAADLLARRHATDESSSRMCLATAFLAMHLIRALQHCSGMSSTLNGGHDDLPDWLSPEQARFQAYRYSSFSSFVRILCDGPGYFEPRSATPSLNLRSHEARIEVFNASLSEVNEHFWSKIGDFLVGNFMAELSSDLRRLWDSPELTGLQGLSVLEYQQIAHALLYNDLSTI